MNIISLGFTMSKMEMLFWYLIFVETRNQLHKVKNSFVETRNQLHKVKNSLEHFLVDPSFNLGIIFDDN